MICPFVVRQKVVCITDLSGHALGFFLNYGVVLSIPRVNDVVTIRTIMPSTCPCGKCPEEIGLLLDEHHNTEVLGMEPVFVWRCFRPLQDRPKEADTDISVFYPMLNFNKRMADKHHEKELT
jgi:hypothetical protein